MSCRIGPNCHHSGDCLCSGSPGHRVPAAPLEFDGGREDLIAAGIQRIRSGLLYARLLLSVELEVRETHSTLTSRFSLV